MSKLFRVAFSFAGEKRGFVAQVAHILAGRFGEDQILYDKYHEAKFARSDLAFYLPALYLEKADLVVAVLCQDYANKPWCGLEWRAIYALTMNRRVDEVMLCRFDHVEGEGLFGLAGFIELDQRTPGEAASLILERLALNEGRPKDYYTTAQARPDWPEKAPTLHWHVADHSEAHDAFAQLITRATPFRLLSIHGGIDTGKSHLTKQFFGNALQIPAIFCGRFDFKSVADPDHVVPPFARQLELPQPALGGDACKQLSQILDLLERRAAPSLLIFDAFDEAGKVASDWVRESLLVRLVRLPWLRIVIVGRKVLENRSEPWAAIGAEPVELHLPSPQAWFEFGRPHKPDITLEFVHTAHTYCKGRSTILAQLLGPA